MHGPFAPMSSRTVQFAKTYHAEQVRSAGQASVAATFGSGRHGLVSQICAMWTAAISHVRRSQQSMVPEHPRSEN